MVELLIRMKADVNATAYNGFTPLHVTEAKDIAALLIRAGADLDKRDNWQDAAAEGGPEWPDARGRGDLRVRVPVRPNERRDTG